MAVSSRGTREIQISKKWKDRDTSPERTKIWTEPNKYNNKNASPAQRKVPVVYYLSRNGQLEHPHFMEVPFSSNDGLYLKDVINRLNVLRGKGFASMYSWSSKRSYRNGFVWHDLSENDFIYPAQGQEYVLKGSELLDPSLSLKRVEKTSSFRAPDNQKLSNDRDHEFPVISRRRNQSWTSVDFHDHEYKVYKTESTGESTRRLAADASTQTDDKRRRRRQIREENEEEIMEELRLNDEKTREMSNNQHQSTELSRGEISPPPSDSSPETLESLMKADGRLILSSTDNNQNANGNNDLNRTAGNNFPSGRMKASSVLMQLISCGSISFRDCGPTSDKDQGFSLIGHYKGRLPRGGVVESQVGTSKEIGDYSGVRLEDKEYFSGSLIETRKEEVPALKRSNSYNADRTSQLQLAEKELDGVRAKCIPRKPKPLPMPAKERVNIETSVENGNNSQRWSKRLEV